MVLRGDYKEPDHELKMLPNEYFCLRHGMYYKTFNCSLCVKEKSIVCKIVTKSERRLNE